SKPRNPAVRIHAQPHVRDYLLLAAHSPGLPLARTTLPPPQHLLPPGEAFFPHLLIGTFAGFKASLDADQRCLVAVEECGIDLHPANYPARDAQTDDDPVERGRVVAARLPAIVPSAGGDVDTGVVDGRLGIGEGGGGRKEFVGKGKNAGIEGGGYEIWKGFRGQSDGDGVEG
ncbi:MAG: hypothetical protein Q9187_001250, partial [Circinaria calcarea]